LKKVLLLSSLIFLFAHFIIWNWYGLNINYPANKKLNYSFELKNQKTSHKNGLHISLNGILSLTILEKGQGLLLEFGKVRGIYGAEEDEKNELEFFFNEKLKSPILVKKSKGGFLRVLYPENKRENSLAQQLFHQIIYYLTFPFPGNSNKEIVHQGPFGNGFLAYKLEHSSDELLYFTIKKRSPFHGSEILNGTFNSIFSRMGYLKSLEGLDEDYLSEGNRVLEKSKMELKFKLLSVQENYQVNLRKIMQKSITKSNSP